MHTEFQPHLAFHLAGMHAPGELDELVESDLRPALFAGYRDLAQLRYDFPLVLVHGGEDATAVQSLCALFDAALRDIAPGPEGERLRRHALRIERGIRALADDRAAGSFAALWSSAASRLSSQPDEALRAGIDRLRAALPADGDVLDCDQAMPGRLLRHAWKAVHAGKARRFASDIGRLIAKLTDILDADFARSPEGLSAANLKAAVGTTHQATFDFDALSGVLRAVAPDASLSEKRRRRIRGLLAVLQSQRFFAADDAGGNQAGAPYPFMFESCAPAIAAYRERLPRMIELTRAIAMAELEIAGEYKESTHDGFFAGFGSDGLDPRDADLFPDYLICVRAAEMNAAETDMLLEAFSAGLRAKVLAQTDDLLEESPIAGGTPAFGLRSKRLASMAMDFNALYVLQASGSHLFQYREKVFRGLTYPGPALFSVFSGATRNGAMLPPYLNAAAAMESRAFPAFVYDPSAGPDWASRFDLADNPQAERDWPVHDFVYEDAAHQSVSKRLAFTLVDFIACDARYARHFACVPRAKHDGMLPVADFLVGQPAGEPGQVPYLLMVDRDDRLQTVIVDDRLMREARRCADAWHSLQELGGIHNSHAARLLAHEKKAWAAQVPPTEPRTNGAAAAAIAPAAPAAPEAPAAAAEPAARSTDEAYIETARCTSCNECTQINDKMFGYDANKQASIINPDAGTYRQLVEAAESCQVSIIHPGKPRNPSEPDLDELVQRAEPYL